MIEFSVADVWHLMFNRLMSFKIKPTSTQIFHLALGCVAIVMMCNSVHAASKAYEEVLYVGQLPFGSVEFILADGYIQASGVALKDGASNRTVIFKMDDVRFDTDQRKFVPISASRDIATDSFILKNLENAPNIITGDYYHGGKSYPVILTIKTR